MIRSLFSKRQSHFLWDDRGIEGPTPRTKPGEYLSQFSGAEGRRWRSCVLRSSNSWSMSISSMPASQPRSQNYVPNRPKTGRQTQCCPQIGAQLSRFRFFYFVLFGLLFSIYDFVNQPAFFVNMVALFSLMTISQGFMELLQCLL